MLKHLENAKLVGAGIATLEKETKLPVDRLLRIAAIRTEFVPDEDP